MLAGSGWAGPRGLTAPKREIVALSLPSLNVLLDRRSSERYAVEALSLQAASVNTDLAFISNSGESQHATLCYG